MNEIYKKLREIRIKQGLTPKKAATALDITPQHLSRLENGRQKPSRNTLEKIIQNYQMPLEDAELLREEFGYGAAASSKKDAGFTAEIVSNAPGAILPKINLDPIRTPVQYTDVVAVSSDDFGLVLNAGQRDAITNEVQIISRVGFSLKHAEKIYEAIGQHIKKLGGQV